MHDHIQSVRTFMEKAGQNLPATPIVPNAETRILRAKLIFEEAMETIDALGVCIGVNDEYDLGTSQISFGDTGKVDLVEIADGCADVLVVTTGTALACGIDPAPVQKLIDDSNLAKFGPGGYKSDGTDGNAEGKWIKPPDWVKPDLAGELERQTAGTGISPADAPPPGNEKYRVWFCKIVVDASEHLPPGFDNVPRSAACAAVEGHIPIRACLSGWGGSLTEGEMAVIEDRIPYNRKGSGEIGLIGLAVVLLLLGVVGSMWGCPHYKVWTRDMDGQAILRQQEWEKQVAVEEARAKLESSKLLSQAEVERAKGVAEANKIIGDSLKDNESYLRYLWIQGLQDGSSEVIYVPTEANLPILEATRKLQPPINGH